MNYTRRKFLGSIGLTSAIGLSGCVGSDGFGTGPSVSEPEPTDLIRNVTVRLNSNKTDPYTINISDDLFSGDNTPYNLSDGQQIRIQIQSDIPRDRRDSYVFTINREPSYSDSENQMIWMSQGGLDRMGIVDNTIVVLQIFTASPTYDNRSSGRSNNELIEQTIATESNTLFMTTTGGQVYPKTELQATRGSSEASFCVWTLSGYGDSDEQAFDQWYNPPYYYDIDSYYKLQMLRQGNQRQTFRSSGSRSFERVVDFTGYSAQKEGIRVGGLAEEELKSAITTNLREELGEDTYSIFMSFEGTNAGLDPQHIANKLSNQSHEGIVIHQTPKIRQDHWRAVSDIVIQTITNYDKQN